MTGGKEGIVFFSYCNTMMGRGVGEKLDPAQDRMNVNRLRLNRTLIGEDLHLIDEIAYSISLIADQAGQRTIIIAKSGLRS